MILYRKLRRTTELANEPIDAENLSYASSLVTGNPTIVFRVRGHDGREYQIRLTDADIAAINHARNITYGKPEYGWPPKRSVVPNIRTD